MANAKKSPDRLRNLLFVLIPSLISILTSCFYVGQDTTKDIIERPAGQWSSRDCLTVVLEAMHHNDHVMNGSSVIVLAVPYTPWVIMALNHMSERRLHWDAIQYRRETDIALHDMSGLYIDWQTDRLVDRKGNYLLTVGQVDSLLFFVTLRNRRFPFYIPDIGDLERRIHLSNDRGNTIKPVYVWGRKRRLLGTLEENLLVMFALRSGTEHALAGSKSIFLKVEGFDGDISLPFSVADLFPHLGNEPPAAETVR